MQKTEEELEEKDKLVTFLKEEAISLKKETEKAVKEHNDAKNKCEHQMNEVSATLNKYKVRTELSFVLVFIFSITPVEAHI